jgi:hypothetical protein
VWISPNFKIILFFLYQIDKSHCITSILDRKCVWFLPFNNCTVLFRSCSDECVIHFDINTNNEMPWIKQNVVCINVLDPFNISKTFYGNIVYLTIELHDLEDIKAILLKVAFWLLLILSFLYECFMLLCRWWQARTKWTY